MAHRLVILYEDSRGPLQRFPLHELVVKSAADLAPRAVHELARLVIAVPKRGVNKVLEAVADCDRLLGGGARVLAWVDNDGIRRALQLAPGDSRGQVIAAIKARAPAVRGPGPKPVEVFVLDDNLEDLVSSVATRLDPGLVSRMRAKRLDARDILLDEIGRSELLRAALRAGHAGFDCVSRFIACVSIMPRWPIPP